MSELHTVRKGFSKKSRLLTRSSYQRVFSNGTKSTDAYFTVLAIENGLLRPRLGLVISRKCSKKAIDRNRLKRIARECFRSIQDEIGYLDLVIVGRTKSKSVENDILRLSLMAHFARLDGMYAKSDCNFS